MSENYLETPKQLAARTGLSERQIRHLIQTRQLEHVMIGCRVHIPCGAFMRFIESKKVMPCHDEIRVPVSVGSHKRNCFYITWTENGRSRERSTGTADRKQAEIVFAEWLQLRGRRDGPSDPVFNPRDRRAQPLSARAGTKARGAGAHRICGAGADRLLRGERSAGVTPHTCGRYAEKRGRSRGTVRRELGVLRAAINYAHRSGVITRPVAVELPERPAPRERWLTRQEAARLLHAARTPQARLYMPLFILLGLYTGRRKEAILSLRWPQVDLEAERINFEVAGRRRTNKKRGVIPIPPRLLPHLRRAKKRGTDLGYVLHISGQRIGDIKKGFAAACDGRRAGLEGVLPHTLRHTAATWIARDGTASLEDAADYLAMSEETLRSVYRHHHPDFLRGAAESIGRRPRNVRVMGRDS